MLKLQDLIETQELDRDAMQAVEGGLSYTSAKSSYYDIKAVDDKNIRLHSLHIWYQPY